MAVIKNHGLISFMRLFTQTDFKMRSEAEKVSVPTSADRAWLTIYTQTEKYMWIIDYRIGIHIGSNKHSQG